MVAQSGSRKSKHVPQRTCVACRRAEAKRGLIRVVRDAEGHVVIDPTGRLNGRGAYLCHDPACWEAALKRRSLERALRVGSLDAATCATLLAYVRELQAEDVALPVLPLRLKQEE